MFSDFKIKLGKRRFVPRLSLLFISVCTLSLYQNCGKGFEVSGGDLSSSSTLSSEKGGWSCRANYDEGSQEKNSRRLTSPEMIASLKVLFGDALIANTEVSSRLASLPVESFFGMQNAFDNSAKNVDGLLDVAETVANLVVNTTANTTALLSCNLTTELTKCQQNLLNDLGLKIFRRPLTATEKTTYQAFMTDVGGKDGVKWALVRMLVSPQFTNILELSDETPNGTRFKLSPYEVASRIAFRLTGATPDATLLAAAGRGELNQIDQIRTQAQRLLALPMAQERTKEMIRNWLDKKSIGDPSVGVATALGINPTGFGDELMNEFNLFVGDVIFTQSGNFKDLLTSKTAFAYTDRLAKLYNMSKSNVAQSFKDNRGGILLRGATLASSKPYSDPIGRGVYMRRKVLCQTIPFPTAQIVSDREKELGEVNRLTTSNRAIVTTLTSPNTCMGCHSSINPIGFALEEFGAAGEARSTENIYDTNGAVLASHALDLSVKDLAIDYDRASPSSNASDLVNAISSSYSARTCFAKQVFAQSRYRFPELIGDGCALNQIYSKISSGQSVKDILIENVANEDIFWRAASN